MRGADCSAQTLRGNALNSHAVAEPAQRGELAGADFLIQFRLVEPADESLQDRIQKSIANYFHYLRSLQMARLVRMLRKSLVLLLIGITILFISVWLNSGITGESSVVEKVFAEGMTVVAWVSMWEALANFLVN